MALAIALAYYVVLLIVSRITVTGKSDNDIFFRASRRSPWVAVAFGMLGASLSGVSFVSVPGMVRMSDMTYMQMCLGFIPGYILVAFVLLPVYYRLRLTSIYSYLAHRFDTISYRTGASFFVLSKLMGAAVRLYLVVLILQHLIFDALGVPFVISAFVLLFLIWLYTRRGGIGTIVWTDCLQTLVMLVALLLIIRSMLVVEGLNVSEAIRVISQDSHSRIFVFDDVQSRHYFWKQFLSGAFIVVVMTGLDQDMMQKNLTCRTLREAQKNMVLNSVLYIPVNLLFLSLGVLMYGFAAHHSIVIPQQGDDLLPLLCGTGALGQAVLVIFTLGIVAAAFSSADSAMTALTTSVCIDMLGRDSDEQLRKRVHASVAVGILLVILAFRILNNRSVIDAVYLIASYTYGPLLGLFAYGLLLPSSWKPYKWAVPVVCVCSPCICYFLSMLSYSVFGYEFGYELLIVNGVLTMTTLCLLRK